jgi:hypothetical protein
MRSPVALVTRRRFFELMFVLGLRKCGLLAKSMA